MATMENTMDRPKKLKIVICPGRLLFVSYKHLQGSASRTFGTVQFPKVLSKDLSVELLPLEHQKSVSVTRQCHVKSNIAVLGAQASKMKVPNMPTRVVLAIIWRSLDSGCCGKYKFL